MKRTLICAFAVLCFLQLSATQVRFCLLEIEAESQVLGPVHRDQLYKVLNLEEGKLQIEKVDIDDIAGLESASAAGSAVYDFVVGKVEDPTSVQLRTQTPPSESSEIKGIKVTVYLLEKDQKVRDKHAERLLFPEEFMDSGVPENVGYGSRFTLGDLTFHGNSAVMKNPACEDLTHLINLLRERPDLIIRIEGHVNGNLGKRYLKQAAKSNPEHVAYENATHLSLARAQTVKRHLVAAGIDPERLEVEGRGGRDKRFPSPQNQAQEDANRRIEILVLAE